MQCVLTIDYYTYSIKPEIDGDFFTVRWYDVLYIIHMKSKIYDYDHIHASLILYRHDLNRVLNTLKMF